MEHIRQAVERAGASRAADVGLAPPQGANWQPPHAAAGQRTQAVDVQAGHDVELNPSYLESQRIIAHDHADVRSKSYDMLRTQVLQSMDLKEWQTIAVTSPSPACGKTVTAVNLALSIARQRERSILLVDMDLQKPLVATRLGLQCTHGLVSVLEGRDTPESVITQVQVGGVSLPVLPCERSVSNSSEWMASSAMRTFIGDLIRGDRSRIVIFDLPPMLTGDDVISVLPQIDCVLFVAAVGVTTMTEIKECNKHLQATTVLRVVLNKVTETGPTSPAYY
jgi:Mrp family chromosome partitioning ATPase